MVGEEVVGPFCIINELRQGAGNLDALKRNGYFGRFPHPSESLLPYPENRGLLMPSHWLPLSDDDAT